MRKRSMASFEEENEEAWWRWNAVIRSGGQEA